jgi:hypothetical protein
MDFTNASAIVTGGAGGFGSATVRTLAQKGAKAVIADVSDKRGEAWPSWRWITLSGTPSRATSTAWAWRSWCGAKRRRIPAWAASRRNSTRTFALDHGRPRVGPSMTQNSGPTGRSTRAASHGRSCSNAHVSIPISRRRPPLPLRTSSEPRRASRSRSPSTSASWMRRPRARAPQSGRAA